MGTGRTLHARGTGTIVTKNNEGLKTAEKSNSTLSLYQLLDPDVLADPYPLFHRLRTEDPVHWDPFLHAWVVTRYADVVTVLHDFSAQRTPSPEKLASLGLAHLNPIAQVMVKQMLFLDASGTHTLTQSCVLCIHAAKGCSASRPHRADRRIASRCGRIQRPDGRDRGSG